MIGKIFIAVLLVSSALAQEENPKEEDENKYKYVKPEIGDLAHLAESFHDLSEFKSRWILSKAKKDGVEDTIAKYDGKWELDEPKDNALEGDLGLMLKSEAKHAAISSKIPTKFEFDTQPLIIQYEVKFQKTQECGGAYIKLLAANPKMSLDEFGDKTLYSIMFGPDKCGHEGKMHFIVQHENPVTGKMTEHHAKAPSGDFSKIFDDKKVHLVTLVVRPANTFEIFVDKKSINSGSLFSDMTPSINPPKEIDDPSDSKPEDWDEREKIPDADATKPDDWDENAPKTIVDEKAVKPAGWLDDEPEHIPDPDAVRPKDWDTEEDGEWEAPLIPNTKCKEVGCGEWKRPSIDNPNYKGKWVPPLIANPAYKGIWAPKKISNPDYFEDTNPFGSLKPIAAVGFELWSMQSDITFDNIILATDQSVVDQWAAQTWDLKQLKEGGGKGVAGGMLDSVLAATEDKPWLWVLYVVVIILPFVLIYTFCFPSKDKTADRKKTDEPTPDDVPEDDNVSNRSVESSEDELLVGPDDQPEAAAPSEASEEAVKPADAEPVAAEPVVEPPVENEPAEDMPELEKVEEVKEAAKEEDTKTPEPELSEEEETATPAKELKSKEEAAEPEIVLAAEKPAEEPVAESEEAKPEVVKDIPEPAVEAKPEPVESDDDEPITNGVPEVTNGVPEVLSTPAPTIAYETTPEKRAQIHINVKNAPHTGKHISNTIISTYEIITTSPQIVAEDTPIVPVTAPTVNSEPDFVEEAPIDVDVNIDQYQEPDDSLDESFEADAIIEDEAEPDTVAEDICSVADVQFVHSKSDFILEDTNKNDLAISESGIESANESIVAEDAPESTDSIVAEDVPESTDSDVPMTKSSDVDKEIDDCGYSSNEEISSICEKDSVKIDNATIVATNVATDMFESIGTVLTETVMDMLHEEPDSQLLEDTADNVSVPDVKEDPASYKDDSSYYIKDDSSISTDLEVSQKESEVDVNETEANITDANETNANEDDVIEADANEADVNKADVNETDANKADVDEADANEADVSETHAIEVDDNDADSNQVDVYETNFNQASTNPCDVGAPLASLDDINMDDAISSDTEAETSSMATTDVYIPPNISKIYTNDVKSEKLTEYVLTDTMSEIGCEKSSISISSYTCESTTSEVTLDVQYSTSETTTIAQEDHASSISSFEDLGTCEDLPNISTTLSVDASTGLTEDVTTDVHIDASTVIKAATSVIKAGLCDDTAQMGSEKEDEADLTPEEEDAAAPSPSNYT